MARMERNAVVPVLYRNSGMREMLIPGARCLKMVVTKLMAPAVFESVKRISASGQKSRLYEGS